MKLVDFVSRIPGQLSFHFYDFSMNFYTFSKFAVFSSCRFCRLTIGTFVSFKERSLGGLFRTREKLAAPFPARRVAGGEGKG